jgi:hypothetical protein
MYPLGAVVLRMIAPNLSKNIRRIRGDKNSNDYTKFPLGLSPGVAASLNRLTA